MKKTKKILYTPPVMDFLSMGSSGLFMASNWSADPTIGDSNADYNPLYDQEL